MLPVIIHLRNHGFLLTDKGWRLSPVYDINPVPDGRGLSLNVTEDDNRLDIDLALEAALWFRISHAEGKWIIENIEAVVNKWAAMAEKYAIRSFEQDLMAPAFQKKA